MHAHLTFRRPMRSRSTPDLAAVFALLSPKMREVTERAHRAMTDAGIRHALAGGLAVGAHGYPRATKDVDFLVGDEAFVEHPGGFVTLNAALPIAIDGIAVDAVSIPVDARFLEQALTAATESEGIPVIPVAALVCMKLLARRPRDRSDIEELVRAGLDVRAVRADVAKHLPELVATFDALVADAQADG